MSADRPIDLSVVIPTHNRSELLGRCLDSLCAQTQDPEGFEVIVIDDGSSDGTEAMLAAFQGRLDLRPLHPGAIGQSAARNAGIEAARGRVCLLLDDDVIASTQLLAEHLAAHAEADQIVGIGALTQEPPAGRDWYAHAFARAWSRHYARLEHEPPSWRDCYGGNLSAPRAMLQAVGGFSTEIQISKDIEIGFRLQRHGALLRYLPRAAAVHDDQKPRQRLLEDLRRQGAGYIELVELHPEMGPELLGWFAVGSRRELWLRRKLISAGVRPGLLTAIGPLLPGNKYKDLWYEFVRKFAFWRAVRGGLSAQQWLKLSGAER